MEYLDLFLLVVWGSAWPVIFCHANLMYRMAEKEIEQLNLRWYEVEEAERTRIDDKLEKLDGTSINWNITRWAFILTWAPSYIVLIPIFLLRLLDERLKRREAVRGAFQRERAMQP